MKVIATVLFVDDDQDLLQAYFDRFSQFGYKVMIASSGKEAIDMVRKFSSIEIAVLDVSMPQMDGFKLLKELRTIKPDLPVAFLSGRNSAELISKTLELRSNCLLEKPCNAQELDFQLKRLLEASRVKKAA